MKGEMLQAETDWKEHTIEFSTSRIPEADAQKIRFIRFFEIGKDVEYWAGNYGAQFKSEFISAVKYSQDKDITSYLPVRPLGTFPKSAASIKLRPAKSILEKEEKKLRVKASTRL